MSDGIPAPSYRQRKMNMSKFAERMSALSTEVEKPGRMIIVGMDRQPLRDKDGSVTYIDLYSLDSEIARKHDRVVTNKRLAMRGRGKITAAELESEALEKLVALTAGWGSISKDGAVTPEDFSPHEARELYGNPEKAELRTQIDEFLNDRANFSKASSTS